MIIHKIILALIVLLSSVLFVQSISYAGNMNNRLCYTLKTGISMEEQVPNGFMGTWRVSSKLLDNGGSPIFKQTGIDLWNLSRTGHVINLTNPFTGASASIRVNYVDGNSIKFTKQGDNDNKILTDTVEIKLEGDLPSPKNPPKACKFHTRCSECMEICTKKEPKIIKISDSHYVKCHLYD